MIRLIKDVESKAKIKMPVKSEGADTVKHSITSMKVWSKIFAVIASNQGELKKLNSKFVVKSKSGQYEGLFKSAVSTGDSLEINNLKIIGNKTTTVEIYTTNDLEKLKGFILREKQSDKEIVLTCTE